MKNPSLLVLLLTLPSMTVAFTVLSSTATATTRTPRILFMSDPNVGNGSSDTNDNDNDNDDCDEDGECEIDWDAMPTATAVTNAASMRKRLEMSWQLEEAAEDCNVDEPQSCGSEPCRECAGKGLKTCRFCRGTKMLFMGDAAINNKFSDCTICREGHECCRSCQGTGWVAGWTQLQETAH